MCSVHDLATRALEPGFWGFDDILWVLIVADLACWWLPLIWGRKGWLGLLGWSVWLSADLHLHRTVRDTSQVHPPLGWYGSQLTSTCPLGLASPFTPRPLAPLWDYLTYPAQLLLQRLNKTLPLFTNTLKGKTLPLSLVYSHHLNKYVTVGGRVLSTWGSTTGHGCIALTELKLQIGVQVSSQYTAIWENSFYPAVQRLLHSLGSNIRMWF